MGYFRRGGTSLDNVLKATLSIVGVVLISIAVVDCGQRERDNSGEVAEATTLPKEGTVVIKVGEVPATVEISRSPEARSRGLMFRDRLPPNRGMLFVFDEEGYHSFWMKDTSIPLSIAFIDSRGEIIQIEDMEPLDDRSTHTPLGPVVYALEMNKGWFREHGIKVGDKVEF